MKQQFKLFVGGMLLMAMPLMMTSCEGALDDIFGEWSRPTPGSSTGGAVTSIGLDADEMKLTVGDKGQLTAKVDPAGTAVTWSSDKEAIATVDANGLVTAVAVGTAIITATANDGSGIKATCNVTVKSPLLAGKFTINASGNQVQFSQGNLQATYDGSAWTWAFAANQWDYIGGTFDASDANATPNNKVTDATPFISVNGTVDLFGWVGASSTWTGVNQYGITSSTATNATDGYGNVAAESLKSDWGTLTISNGGNTANFGWRTLTREEWTYLFNTRSASTVDGTPDARYAKAYLFGTTHGVILFPDSYTHPDGVNPPTGINATNSTSWNANTYSAADWAKMEAAGCVFLPAAGIRGLTSVDKAGSNGYYWSSSSHDTENAYYVSFLLDELHPASSTYRFFGGSVRLVRPVE